MVSTVQTNTTDRVNLVYQMSVGDKKQEIELPLKLLVMGDFTGDERAQVYDGQASVPVSDTGLSGVFASLQPVVTLRVKNVLIGKGEFDIQLPIYELDDFNPKRLASNVPEIAKTVRFIETLGNAAQAQDVPSLEEDDQELINALLATKSITWESLKQNLATSGWLISDLERRVTDQIDHIIHHDVFSELESAWRSLSFLIQRTDFSENCEISVLNTSKQALLEDFEDSPEVMQSGLYQLVYSSEFGQFGGTPYAAVIGNYRFGPKSQDVRLLQRIASVCAISHAPFIAAASHEFFQIDSYSEFSKLRDITSIFDHPGYEKWKSFRKSPDARYVGLTLPSFILRPLHVVNLGSIEYREKVSSVDNDLTWGNAAFALASRLVSSFARYRWCLNITGKVYGKVEGLNIDSSSGDSARDGKIPTQFLLTDKREAEVVAQGFIPLCVRKGEDIVAFYSAYSTQSFKGADKSNGEVDLSTRLGAQIPYLLIISRISHYIKMMQREHIGSWKNRRDIDHELNNWLKRYVSDMDNPAPGVRGRRPLRNAEIKVREVEGKGDWFLTRIKITPHIKFMGDTFTLSETGKLEKA